MTKKTSSVPAQKPTPKKPLPKKTAPKEDSSRQSADGRKTQQIIDDIANLQESLYHLDIEHKKITQTLLTKIDFLDFLLKTIAVMMICIAVITAVSSIKCNIVPTPPKPIPGPIPKPSPDTEKETAIDICMNANAMNTTHTYQQRLVWASQEIVQQLGWPTEKAVDFAREYVTNF